jgi:hypothetical protein
MVVSQLEAAAGGPSRRSRRCGHGNVSSIMNSRHPTQATASGMAPITAKTGAKGCGSERAAGSAAMQ